MQYRTKLLCWLLLPLILLASTAGLYYFSPKIAELALQRWLAQQNFSDIQLHMQPPGWNELRIEQLSLLKQNADQEILYKINHLTLRFNPVEMFSLHRVNELLIQEAEVRIKYKSLPKSSDSGEIIDLQQALPSQWFHQVPVDRLTIAALKLDMDYPEGTSDWKFNGAFNFTQKKLTSRVHFQRDDQDLGWADLEVREHDLFNLRLLLNDQPILVINGQLNHDNVLGLQSSQLIDLNGFLKWQKKVLQTEFEHPEISGSLSSRGTTTFPLKTQFTPDTLLASIETQQTLNAQFEVLKPANVVSSVSAVVSGKLEFSENILNINLDNQTSAVAHELTPDFATQPILETEVNLPQGLTITADLSTALQGQELIPSLTLTELELSTPRIALEQGILEPTITQLQVNKIDLNNKTISGRLSNNSIEVQLPEQTLLNAAFNTSFNFKDNLLNGEFALTTDELPINLKGKYTSELATSKSNLSWVLTPIRLHNIDRTLTPYLAVPAELSISAGRFYHNGSASIENGIFTARLYNSVRAAAASWEEYRFENIDWDSRTRLKAGGIIIDKGSVKLQRAKTGVDITEIESAYVFRQSGKWQRLDLKQLTAKLLQGDISVEAVSFNPAKPEFKTNVNVDQIDLGEVLSLEQQEGLSGEGKLSGTFPVDFQKDGLTIEDGGLFSLDPGGKILFAPNPAVMAYAATNVGLKMALEALENFHFDLLDITLNYSKDGTANLNTRLKGNNPDWNNGHPVDFTINIEENIPKLLQALQFTEKLTKTIEKRYR
ncbi:MAG: YdbH domain-containing protein [Neptuniibacter sp.]